MADKLVSPGPRHFMEGDGKGVSRAGATWIDILTKQINRLKSIETITTADADNLLGAQALANANKAKINEILYALGADVQEDDPPVETPEDVAEVQSAYVKVEDAFTAAEADFAVTGGSGYVFDDTTAPLGTNRHNDDPQTLSFSCIQEGGATVEVEYQAVVSNPSVTVDLTIALTVDGTIVDWTLNDQHTDVRQPLHAHFRTTLSDSFSHTFGIAVYSASTSTTLQQVGRRLLTVRERRNSS